MASKPPSQPPRSVTSQLTALIGLAGFLATLMLLRQLELPKTDATVVGMLGTALPMLFWELFVLKAHRQEATGLQGFGLRLSDRINWGRVATKLTGLWGTIGLLSVAYWIFPEYQRDFYKPFWDVCRDYSLAFACISFVYFVLIDRWMKDPEDEYFNAGRLFLGHGKGTDRARLKKHFLGWLIKGFFLPLMFIYFGNSIAALLGRSLADVTGSFTAFVAFMSRFATGIDLAFVSIGYVLTLRLTNSHIRSPNDLFWGWAVTLLMYVPFFAVVGNRYLDYKDDTNWIDMFGGGDSSWFYVWGCAIIFTKIMWAWSNLSFGIRFSNLTNRGIITNGPFRLMRHPSYFFKNISWWLLAVPFYSVESYETALQHSILMVGINLIYFARAKAEEKHLSEDPVYVEYALWIEEHGILRWLRHYVPFIRYVPPAGAGSMRAA